MTTYATIGERVNLSLCDAGHESDDDIPHLVSIEGLAEDDLDLYLCAAHRASLLAMLKRRFAGNETVRAAVAAGDSAPWIRGAAPHSGWVELTEDWIDGTCARSGTSRRAWWAHMLRMVAMGVYELAGDEDGHTYMRTWELASAPASSPACP